MGDDFEIQGVSMRQLDTDDPRWSSYLTDPESRRTCNVTRTLWEMRGEAGLASNTTDRIALPKALLVDKTRLEPAALAEMQGWLDIGIGSGEPRSSGSVWYR